MATSMNRVLCAGYLGQDPKQFGAVTVFSVATKESWKDKQGEWQSHTEWINCKAFGYVAEQANKLTKGSFVVIEGSLKTDKYTGKDGVEKTQTQVVVSSIVAPKQEQAQQVELVADNWEDAPF